MGIGGELVGNVEQLLVRRTLQTKKLFRMIGASSQCWHAESDIDQLYAPMRSLLLPSATVGLSLLLEILDLPKGSEVLITPFGWVSNWSCIQRAGLVPRFLPLDDRLQIRTEFVSERLSKNTSLVIVTHLLGRGHQCVAEIAQLCADRGVFLLEDIAQSFGLSIGGQRAGTFGRGAWCSLNHHKLLSTGDGGFVLIKDQHDYERLTARHDQGISMAAGKRQHLPVVEPGLSLRSNEVTAAILRGQLARYHFIRTRIYALYEALAAECRDHLGLDLIELSFGDLPLAIFFKRSLSQQYPSLFDSGWHIAGRVPWLADTFNAASRDDQAVNATMDILASISAIGTGFVDQYYGIPCGLRITQTLSDVPGFVEDLRKQLCS